MISKTVRMPHPADLERGDLVRVVATAHDDAVDRRYVGKVGRVVDYLDQLSGHVVVRIDGERGRQPFRRSALSPLPAA